MSEGMIVEMAGISKHFGAFAALSDVSLNVRSGQIHAVVGENGAGKTTLMKILQGLHLPEKGTLKIDGKVTKFTKPADAIAAGIGMVSQHYSIIPELTCIQNLLLGNEPAPIFSYSAAKQRATELAAQMGFEFDWDAPASGLSPAGGQKLEILKLLWRNTRIMILDEPTAMLSPADSDALFASLKQLVAEGATVIVVTHRIPEVLEHCQRLTVLRGGKLIEEREVEGLTSDHVVELIVGRSISQRKQESAQFDGNPVLWAEGLVVKGDRGATLLDGATLSIRPGQMLGLAGVDGNGQRQLFHALTGVQKLSQGRITLDGVDITYKTPAEFLRAGVRLIPEDRLEEGAMESWNLIENTLLGYQRFPSLQRNGQRDQGALSEMAERVAARFSTKFASLKNPLKSLSGGNQQRFIAGRALEENPRLILAFQPTRGLDIDATENVYRGIRTLCRETGAAALIVSFDLDELIEQCDRVVAVCHGVLTAPVPGKEMDRSEIGRLMVGA